MQKAIRSKASRYDTRFGIVPEFKAGIHLGEVTTGEVGGVKREVVFTGDVLNTTARIQDQCNEQGVDILVSSELVELLGANSHYHFREVGEFQLRGKDEQTYLFTVDQPANA